MSSANKHRWGMLPGAAGELGSSTLEWDDFDHSQTLCLGFSGSTSIVYQKHTFNSFLLRFSKIDTYTSHRSQLVEIARTDKTNSFLNTKSVFEHKQRIYVASELSDISLEDIIDCTIPLNKIHLSSVLSQVCSFKG